MTTYSYDRTAAADADGGEAKLLSLLKLDIARAKEAASDLWSVTDNQNQAARKEREKVYLAISKLDEQVARWKPTR
jgi:hypothetical protein